MRIVAPNSGTPVTGETATLTVEASDQGGVAEIRLYHNGKLVAEDTRQIGLLRLSLDVHTASKNYFQIS